MRYRHPLPVILGPRAFILVDTVITASNLTVNPDTGRGPWRHVAVPGNPGGFDVPRTPLIVTPNGHKTIVLADKTGDNHCIDAETGREHQAVPAPTTSSVQWLRRTRNAYRSDWDPPERRHYRNVTQLDGRANPCPTAYSPLTCHVLREDMEMGMTHAFEEIQTISNMRRFGGRVEFMVSCGLNPATNLWTGVEIWRDQKDKSG